ncbi:glutathione S-transferase theta-1-like [Narcine bancroftii]|uniref:glutathione S-transferase theta-1-like n=1 Tax=Narcine bancroftii TaxID=1343680 RepID=UPI0038316B34
MALQLYGDLISQPCRSVYIFLKKNNIPFEFKVVQLFEGEQYSEEFQKINPLGKVPVLKEGDFVLTESAAILTYLAESFHTPAHWYPTDLQYRARVDEYLSWQHTALRPQASKLFLLKALVPFVPGFLEPEARLREAEDALNQSLDQFDQKFLRDQLYLAGAEISLADVVAIVELMQPLGAGCDPLEGRVTLTAWRERVKTALGKDLFDEVHESVMNAQQKLKWISQNQPAALEGLVKIIQKGEK